MVFLNIQNSLSLQESKTKIIHNGMNAPISVCWDITHKCNYHCQFCYRLSKGNDLNYEQSKIILQKIILSGVKKITFTGGDPLLVDFLPELILNAKNAGIITSIDTNGSLLENLLSKISNIVDWVTLPIDGSTESIQEKMTRSHGHLNRVYLLVKELHKLGIKVKINTLVSEVNKSDIGNIAMIVNSLGVERWKLFQFLPVQGEAIKSRKIFQISDNDFNNIIDKTLSDHKSEKNCKVTVADRKYFSGNYFHINHDGSVRVYHNNRNIIVGNVLESNISSIWHNPYFDHIKHFDYRSWLLN